MHREREGQSERENIQFYHRSQPTEPITRGGRNGILLRLRDMNDGRLTHSSCFTYACARVSFVCWGHFRQHHYDSFCTLVKRLFGLFFLWLKFRFACAKIDLINWVATSPPLRHEQAIIEMYLFSISILTQSANN